MYFFRVCAATASCRIGEAAGERDDLKKITGRYLLGPTLGWTSKKMWTTHGKPRKMMDEKIGFSALMWVYRRLHIHYIPLWHYGGWSSHIILNLVSSFWSTIQFTVKIHTNLSHLSKNVSTYHHGLTIHSHYEPWLTMVNGYRLLIMGHEP